MLVIMRTVSCDSETLTQKKSLVQATIRARSKNMEQTNDESSERFHIEDHHHEVYSMLPVFN